MQRDVITRQRTNVTATLRNHTQKRLRECGGAAAASGMSLAISVPKETVCRRVSVAQEVTVSMYTTRVGVRKWVGEADLRGRRNAASCGTGEPWVMGGPYAVLARPGAGTGRVRPFFATSMRVQGGGGHGGPGAEPPRKFLTILRCRTHSVTRILAYIYDRLKPDGTQIEIWKSELAPCTCPLSSAC